MNPETRIQNAALLAIGQRQDTFAMRLQSGVFRAMDSDRTIKVGQPGMADVLVLVAVQITPEMVGRTVAVPLAAEFKTKTGRQSPAQRAWQTAVQQRGAIYKLVRSPADLENAIQEVQRGIW